MGPFHSRTAQTGGTDWSRQEHNDLVRVKLLLERALGEGLDLVTGLTDEGEPWSALLREDDGEVVAHFARLRRSVLADLPAHGETLEGRTIREICTRVLSTAGLGEPRREQAASNVIHATFGAAARALVAMVFIPWQTLVKGRKAEAAEREDEADRQQSPSNRFNPAESRWSDMLLAVSQILSLFIASRAMAAETDRDPGPDVSQRASGSRLTDDRSHTQDRARDDIDAALAPSTGGARAETGADRIDLQSFASRVLKLDPAGVELAGLSLEDITDLLPVPVEDPMDEAILEELLEDLPPHLARGAALRNLRDVLDSNPELGRLLHMAREADSEGVRVLLNRLARADADHGLEEGDYVRLLTLGLTAQLDPPEVPRDRVHMDRAEADRPEITRETVKAKVIEHVGVAREEGEHPLLEALQDLGALKDNDSFTFDADQRDSVREAFAEHADKNGAAPVSDDRPILTAIVETVADGDQTIGADDRETPVLDALIARSADHPDRDEPAFDFSGLGLKADLEDADAAFLRETWRPVIDEAMTEDALEPIAAKVQALLQTAVADAAADAPRDGAFRALGERWGGEGRGAEALAHDGPFGWYGS